MSRKARIKTTAKAAVILAALLVLAASCMREVPRKTPTISGTEVYDPPATTVSDKSYDKFSHETAEHAAIACDSCHRRETGEMKLEFPGHDSCVSCHTGEFTDPEGAMCAICHSDLKTVPAGMRPFPASFNEGFNMKFDHAVHSQ